jgi:pimeloyl-ACP methyl ester carboxylesterase
VPGARLRAGVTALAVSLAGLLVTAPQASSAAPAPAAARRGQAPAAFPRRPSPSPAQTLGWHSCDTRFRCATLSVPVSYSDPRAGSLGIAVVELPATGKASEDVLMNPGGPGASGVQFLEQGWSEFPAAFRAHANLVGFDPRGVGASDPVRCLDTAQERAWVSYDPDPHTTAQIDADVAQAKAFVAGCLAHTSKLLLANVGTVDAAQDLDRLRAALGQAKLDYIGFSYGTYLGEVYAEKFPSHVGHFVLDGVIDPALSSTATGEQQALGFEDDLKAFFAWCGTNTSCEHLLPGGAQRSWQELVSLLSEGAKLEAPLVKSFGGEQTVDVGMAETAAASALYTTATWSVLAQAISQALQGNGALLALLAYSLAGANQNGSFSNETDANMAINCVDSPSPHKLSTYASLAATFAKVSPDFGAEESWGDLPCAYWPFPVTGLDGAVHAPGTPTVLIVGSTGDPATPYQWARAVARQFPHAVLLTRRGEGHTGYGSSACVRSYVDAFLEHGALPEAGTVCASS